MMVNKVNILAVEGTRCCKRVDTTAFVMDEPARSSVFSHAIGGGLVARTHMIPLYLFRAVRSIAHFVDLVPSVLQVFLKRADMFTLI
jgi:hypothetical protein